MRIAALLILLALAPYAHGQSAETLLLPERSSFRHGENLRNPFHPIGWVKPDPAAAAEPVTTRPDAASQLFRADRFQVTSISTGAMPLASINGRLYGEGDLVPFSDTGVAQVVRIRDGAVVLRYRQKELLLTIRRLERTPER